MHISHLSRLSAVHVATDSIQPAHDTCKVDSCRIYYHILQRQGPAIQTRQLLILALSCNSCSCCRSETGLNIIYNTYLSGDSRTRRLVALLLTKSETQNDSEADSTPADRHKDSVRLRTFAAADSCYI